MLSLGDDTTECLLLPALLCDGGTINPALLDGLCPKCGPDVGMVSGGRCIVSQSPNILAGTSSVSPNITLDILRLAFSSVLVLMFNRRQLTSVGLIEADSEHVFLILLEELVELLAKG